MAIAAAGLAMTLPGSVAAQLAQGGELSDLCWAVRRVLYDAPNDFNKLKGSQRRSGGKYNGKASIPGTRTCIMTPANGSSGAAYRCFSADSGKAQTVAALQQAVNELERRCLQGYQREQEVDASTGIPETTWERGNVSVRAFGDTLDGQWYWGLAFRVTSD